jgi:hypothetical protein
MNREDELHLKAYMSTLLANWLGEQVSLMVIEHEISYDIAKAVTRSALELNLSLYRDGPTE